MLQDTHTNTQSASPSCICVPHCPYDQAIPKLQPKANSPSLICKRNNSTGIRGGYELVELISLKLDCPLSLVFTFFTLPSSLYLPLPL